MNLPVLNVQYYSNKSWHNRPADRIIRTNPQKYYIKPNTPGGSISCNAPVYNRCTQRNNGKCTKYEKIHAFTNTKFPWDSNGKYWKVTFNSGYHGTARCSVRYGSQIQYFNIYIK